jgi:hypothetical protein
MTQTPRTSTIKLILRSIRSALFFTALLLAGIGLRLSPSVAENARAIPAPTVDETAGQAPSEVAVLAGGCFWGVQGVFHHVEGVTNAVSGYAGGDKKTAGYELTRCSSRLHSHRTDYDWPKRHRASHNMEVDGELAAGLSVLDLARRER